MTFTDDDLRKLMGFISIDDFYQADGSRYIRPLIKALVQRMEAAERCAGCAQGQIERLEIELATAREKGFHEGKEFALMTIANAVVNNLDRPALAVITAMEALTKVED